MISVESEHAPVTFVWTGDLHLTQPGLSNHRDALAAIEQINTLLRPDFVQFAGDNVQDAQPEQFKLFNALRSRLQVPHHVLVGDHDVHQDPQANGFRQFVGDTFGSFVVGGFHFIRLNTLEHRPAGLSEKQVDWFRAEVDSALSAGRRVVIFQHHYPYKVWEQFDGPGLDAWRELVQTRRIAAVFCGHTHYGQIANDGRNVSIASRSIGDPEGGPPGYTVAHLHGEDLAVIYRPVADRGPLALITHPRDVLLATGPRHIVSGPDRISARVWSAAPVTGVEARIDNQPWASMTPATNGWIHPLPVDALAKGEHHLEVRAVDQQGATGGHAIQFMYDPTGRYTAIPAAVPVVKGTAFA
jgi:hypothetical protein